MIGKDLEESCKIGDGDLEDAYWQYVAVAEGGREQPLGT